MSDENGTTLAQKIEWVKATSERMRAELEHAERRRKQCKLKRPPETGDRAIIGLYADIPLEERRKMGILDF